MRPAPFLPPPGRPACALHRSCRRARRGLRLPVRLHAVWRSGALGASAAALGRGLGALLAQHAADLLLHIAALDDVRSSWPLCLLPVEEVSAQLLELLRILRRQLRHGPSRYLLHER